MWDFARLRKYAIKTLEAHWVECSPATFLRLAVDHDIDHWLLRAYTDLIIRAEPISWKEASAIGLKATVLLAHLREEVWRCSYSVAEFEDSATHGHYQCIKNEHHRSKNELVEWVRTKINASEL